MELAKLFCYFVKKPSKRKHSSIYSDACDASFVSHSVVCCCKVITSQVMQNEPYKFDVALKYAKNRLADIVQIEERRKV